MKAEDLELLTKCIFEHCATESFDKKEKEVILDKIAEAVTKLAGGLELSEEKSEYDKMIDIVSNEIKMYNKILEEAKDRPNANIDLIQNELNSKIEDLNMIKQSKESGDDLNKVMQVLHDKYNKETRYGYDEFSTPILKNRFVMTFPSEYLLTKTDIVKYSETSSHTISVVFRDSIDNKIVKISELLGKEVEYNYIRIDALDPDLEMSYFVVYDGVKIIHISDGGFDYSSSEPHLYKLLIHYDNKVYFSKDHELIFEEECHDIKVPNDTNEDDECVNEHEVVKCCGCSIYDGRNDNNTSDSEACDEEEEDDVTSDDEDCELEDVYAIDDNNSDDDEDVVLTAEQLNGIIDERIKVICEDGMIQLIDDKKMEQLLNQLKLGVEEIVKKYIGEFCEKYSK